MEFGVCYFPTHYGMGPAEVAAAAEQRGFESLLFCEHTHIPTSRKSPYPGGGELPKMYVHTYDPFVACTAAAAATSRLKIGTGVCLVVERDPITTAKEVASVDRLSGGRFLEVDAQPMNNIYLSLLDRMGVTGVPRLGDSTGRLDGI